MPSLDHLIEPYWLDNFTDYTGGFYINRMDAYTLRSVLENALSASLVNGTRKDMLESVSRGQVFYEADDFPALLEQICESLTIAIRQGPNSTSVAGRTANMEQYITFHWAWMALPASLVLISIFFLSALMMLNFDESGAAWKSSTIPILFHGVVGWKQEQLLEKELDKMEDQARTVTAQLRKDENDGLKLARGNSDK